MLYLVPELDQPFREMTAAVYERWPQCPPYAGKYPDGTPHLSVLYDRTEDEVEQARRDIQPRLPLRVRAAAVDLLIFDGDRWNVREGFPLAAP